MASSINRINERFGAMRQRAETLAPNNAAKAMAVVAVAAVKAELSRRSHAPGEPAGPPGAPPSLVSGHLRDSIVASPPVLFGAGRASITVGSTAIYASIQEKGGVIEPKGGTLLAWVDGSGNWSFASQVTLPARPYMKPAIEGLKLSGKLRKAAIASWRVSLEIAP